MTVTPTTGLTDGAKVTIKVTGLAAGTFVGASQCGGTDANVDDCDFQDFPFAQAGSGGTATLTLAVDAVLHLFSQDAPVDCRIATCAVNVEIESSTSVTTTPRVPIAFAPGTPLAPPPTIAITPAPTAPLRDGQAVNVRVTGMVWGTFATVLECSADPVDQSDCDFDTAISVSVTNGSFTLPYTLSSRIGTDRLGTVDCAQAGKCVLVATLGNGEAPEKTGVLPLVFDPAGGFVVPTMTVTPATDLVDGQNVTVAGKGFPTAEFTFVNIYVCGPASAGRPCDFLDEVDEPANGAFSRQVEVSAQIFGGAEPVDCRDPATPCDLVATTGSTRSPRAAIAPLAFRPGGPLRPGPEISLTPATGLPNEGDVHVAGSHFGRGDFVQLQVCRTGDIGRCDDQAEAFVSAEDDGTFATDLSVAATFTDPDGQAVDCRADPGCQVVARDFERNRTATAPLAFGPAPTPTRYLDPVFDQVDVTRDVVYRNTTDAAGRPVQLTLDVYQPVGDTAGLRPALVWLPDGWFGGPGSDLAARYADAFARRGYVVITPDVRTRPGLQCCPTDDAVGIKGALLDAYDDATAAVRWLGAHAGDYRVDPQAIVAGGSQGGGATALDLAHLPGQEGRPKGSVVAAAVGVAGVDLGRPDKGEPAVLALHDVNDQTAPLHLSQWACTRAHAVGSRCETFGYSGFFDDLARNRQRDITGRAARFLAGGVLIDRGFIQRSVVPAAARPATPGSAGFALAADSEPAPTSGRTGVALAVLGVVLVGLGWTRRRSDAGAIGGTGLIAIAAVAVLGIGAVGTWGAINDWSLGGPKEEETSDPPTTEHDMGAMEGMDHDKTPMNHDSTTGGGDHDAHGGTGAGTGHDAHDASTGGGDHDAHGGTGAGTGHDAHGGTGAGTGHDAHGDTRAGTGHDAHGGGATTHGHTGGPGGHTGGGSHGHTEPPPSTDGFDPTWTPAQVAYARKLIKDTTASLPRYANPGILPLVGYVWILDGTGPNQYQHWINTQRIIDGHTLDPAFPESLVFRNASGGPKLEAAMYMLAPGVTLDTVPANIAWLPGWHVHKNLCFDGSFRVVGLTDENGNCAKGSNFITPPMVHIWIVDTPCGRFAGVDENGLQCTPHEHDH
ncbi:MAG TPA: neocarzinostatin apoprotein domain-containing protein [Acidimicrobiales bacterium]|nr:neocarzinostatin apoprotein domain-containing protein [Acidimicrobiales bacterium]